MRFATAVVTLVFATASFADTLTLKSGRVVNGTFLGGTARQIRMEVADGIQTFDITEVSSLQFGGTMASSATTTSPATTTSSSAQASTAAPVSSPAPQPAGRAVNEDNVFRPTTTASAQAPASSSGVELPAGTTITIRMIDAVDSETNRVGQTFNASLDEPVIVDGNTVIPRGADAVVKLVESQESGKIAGRATLVLDLVSVKVGGRTVDMNSQTVSRESGSRGSRTAKMATGGAALGAIIGAIAGGGKGAAIGAVSGAGAGTAAEVITKGERVRIPSETRLTFTLDTAVRL